MDFIILQGQKNVPTHACVLASDKSKPQKLAFIS